MVFCCGLSKWAMGKTTVYRRIINPKNEDESNGKVNSATERN